MQLETWKITNASGGFHFGRHGLGQEETASTMPSDSLFAALLHRIAVSQGAPAVEEFLHGFQTGDPPLALSSTFPFAGEVRFYPVPLLAASQTAAEANAKEYKRVQFVSEGLFKRLLKGEKLAAVSAEAGKYMGGKVWAAVTDTPGLPKSIRSGMPIWEVETRPRVTLGRAAQNSTIFFTGRVQYAQECGLWFGINWPTQDPARKAQLANLFAELGDAGIGAERSAGFGLCSFEPAAALELPGATHRPWVNLSRYLPREDEIEALEWQGAGYKLVRVGGWLDSPVRRGQRRRAITLVEEGAVLGSVKRPIPGAIVDVRPQYEPDDHPLNHPVYRAGLAVAVGWEGGQA